MLQKIIFTTNLLYFSFKKCKIQKRISPHFPKGKLGIFSSFQVTHIFRETVNMKVVYLKCYWFLPNSLYLYKSRDGMGQARATTKARNLQT